MSCGVAMLDADNMLLQLSQGSHAAELRDNAA
jgi:hypothetical protein